MTKVVAKKILLFFLTLTGLLFSSNEVFAATIETPTNVPTEVQISQTFSFNTNITGTQAGEVYFVKCRLGQTSASLTEGQSYNSTTNTWLSDTNSWIDFPTVNTSGNSVSGSIQCRVKSNAPSGQKVIYARACLKKSDGSCGTSFQSSSGTPTNAISSSSTTSTPTPTPSPTPSSSSSSSTSSSFTISNTPSQINSDQSFNAFINLSLSSNSSTTFYLKGAFKKIGSSNYFGKTLVSGSWIKNNSSYSEQYKITTDSSGNWSGNLEIQPDSEDSGYSGTGDYLFKVGRYTQSGSGPTWSNEATIKIASVTSTEQGGVVTATSSIATPQTSPSSSSKTASTKSSKQLVYHIASVAGESTASTTPSATPATEVKSQKQTNILTIIGIVAVIIGTITLGYAIYNWFRLRNKEVS